MPMLYVMQARKVAAKLKQYDIKKVYISPFFRWAKSTQVCQSWLCLYVFAYKRMLSTVPMILEVHPLPAFTISVLMQLKLAAYVCHSSSLPQQLP